MQSRVYPQYYPDQAHHVALLMHHEVVASDAQDELCSFPSPFDEDYWDDCLMEMEMERQRTDKQRQSFQGCSMTLSDTSVTSWDLSGDGIANAVESTPAKALTLNWNSLGAWLEKVDQSNTTGQVSIIKDYDDDTLGNYIIGELYNLENMNRLAVESTPAKGAYNYSEKPGRKAVESTPAVEETNTVWTPDDHYIITRVDEEDVDYLIVETYAPSYDTKRGHQQHGVVDCRSILWASSNPGKGTAQCRLLDEWFQDTDAQGRARMSEDVATGEEAPIEQPMLVIDQWEELRLILAETPREEDEGLNLALYGLYQTSIGTRHATTRFDIPSIRESVLEAWSDYFTPGTVAYLHMVRPQNNPSAKELQLIVEFSSNFFPVPAVDVPVLRKFYWPGVWDGSEPVAEYNTPDSTTFQLLIQCGLREWCGPDLRTICHLHAERSIAPPLSPVALRQGSRLEVFVHFDEIEDDGANLLQLGSWCNSPSPHVSDRCCGKDFFAPAARINRRHQSTSAAKDHAGGDDMKQAPRLQHGARMHIQVAVTVDTIAKEAPAISEMTPREKQNRVGPILIRTTMDGMMNYLKDLSRLHALSEDLFTLNPSYPSCRWGARKPYMTTLLHSTECQRGSSKALSSLRRLLTLPQNIMHGLLLSSRHKIDETQLRRSW